MSTPDIEPARNRDEIVDALRGVAVMGILAVNILIFAWPFKVSYTPALIEDYGLELTALNRWIHLGTLVLFSFKMQFLFGLLFGAGVIYYSRKFEKGPITTGAGLWYRRMAVLFVLGLAHAIGLWYGDILVWYATLGMVALWWARRWTVALQIGVGVPLLVYGWLANLGFSQLMLMQPGDAFQIEMDAHTGGYVDAVLHRLVTLAVFYLVALPFLFLPYFFGVMLLGMALLRSGVLRGEKPRVSAAMALVGLPIGIGLSSLAMYQVVQADYDYRAAVNWTCLVFVGGAPTALGYVGLFTLVFGGGRLGVVTRILAPVGRMALTNYLAQTVICTTIFYGYGFGYYGKMDLVAMAGVVGSIWLFNIVLSNIWLSMFRFGPMEWLWRTLTYGRPPRMTREAAPPAE